MDIVYNRSDIILYEILLEWCNYSGIQFGLCHKIGQLSQDKKITLQERYSLETDMYLNGPQSNVEDYQWQIGDFGNSQRIAFIESRINELRRKPRIEMK